MARSPASISMPSRRWRSQVPHLDLAGQQHRLRGIGGAACSAGSRAKSAMRSPSHSAEPSAPRVDQRGRTGPGPAGASGSSCHDFTCVRYARAREHAREAGRPSARARSPCSRRSAAGSRRARPWDRSSARRPVGGPGGGDRARPLQRPRGSCARATTLIAMSRMIGSPPGSGTPKPRGLLPTSRLAPAGGRDGGARSCCR